MKFVHQIVLLLITILLSSCNTAVEKEVDDAIVKKEQHNNYTLITIEIDTIPTRSIDKYNPYIYHPQNYKPSYPLLISEPDKYIHRTTRTAKNFDTLVPSRNIEMTSHVFPTFGKSTAIKGNGKKTIQFLMPNEEAEHPATHFHLTGNAYAMNGMYDKALIAFKRAEEELQNFPDSVVAFSLQQRMAELHRLIYSSDSVIISKYHQAAATYKKQQKYKSMLPFLYSHIGSMYIYSQFTDSARHYLRLALNNLNSSSFVQGQLTNVVPYTNLMALNNFEGKFENTLLLWEKTRFYNSDANITYRVAEAYLGLDQIEKANGIYSQYGYTWSNIKQYVFLSDYYQLTKDYEKALHYELLENRYVDSVRATRTSRNIVNLENEYNLQQLEIQEQKTSNRAQARLFFIFIISLVLLLSVAIIILILLKRRKEEEQYNNMVEQLKNENTAISVLMEENTARQQSEDAKLMESLQHRLDTVNKLLSSSYQFIDSPDKFIKHFKDAMELDKNSNSNLDDICTMINRKYNNITGRIKKDFPNITSDDERLIALICAKYSTMSIAVLFNTTNLGTVYNKKSRLLKKLGTEGPLEQLIESYKNN